jgi:S-DNA-T family DNA segregation ATPase FtsK/SpoIIIE
VDPGPVITQVELELAAGIKIGKIIGLSDDIARALKAQSVRVVAPIPGKSTVGIEVPNSTRQVVRLRELFESGILQRKRMTLPLLLGKDASGEPLVADLAQMPHLLIAGATGSGKSVCMNSIIMTFLLTQSPEDVKLILIDPKMVELSAFRDIPHLMTPVLTDMKKASAVLEWATHKMDERYSMLANVGVRNIAAYNALGEKEIRRLLDVTPEDDLEGLSFHLPHIIIIIDELADLMMVSAKDVENTITRLAQKSRAVGIHLIVATQRPSVDVVTGLIKANLPSRLAFQTASKVDSRTILDRNGAEKLLGRGDMLFLPPGSAKLIRGQGAFTSDEEIRRVTALIAQRAKPRYDAELSNPQGLEEGEGAAQDPLFDEAVRIILESQRGSVSLLQRKLGIGYGRASRLVDLMAAAGIVGEYKGSQAREVLFTLEDWEAHHGKAEGQNGGG